LFTTTKLENGGGWIEYVVAVTKHLTAAAYSIQPSPLSNFFVVN
jgi:hypothetical protein